MVIRKPERRTKRKNSVDKSLRAGCSVVPAQCSALAADARGLDRQAVIGGAAAAIDRNGSLKVFQVLVTDVVWESLQVRNGVSRLSRSGAETSAGRRYCSGGHLSNGRATPEGTSEQTKSVCPRSLQLPSHSQKWPRPWLRYAAMTITDDTFAGFNQAQREGSAFCSPSGDYHGTRTAIEPLRGAA